MSNDINTFTIGFAATMDKIAASSNPAAPQKSSRGGMERSDGPAAAYLNQGGGKAGKHSAGGIESRPQPWPGHVNIGDKSPGQQTAGDVGGRGGSPDTGDLGMGQSGDQTVTKSAAFEAGIQAVADALLADDA